MANNRPVRICAIRHSPSRDPKFHHPVIVDGVGRSTSAWFAIFIRGCLLRMGLFIYFVCRRGPLDTLMMFTTTISVSSMYRISKVVIIPVVWLYIVIVVVRISFSVIVSWVFISLLLVCVGIIIIMAGRVIRAIKIILFDGENISFDASLVMYMNNTSIPPIMIMNRMYENQNLLYIIPLTKHVSTVCTSSIIPIAKGCFICVNINLVIILVDRSAFMSGGIL